jgi:hypothetical protein
MIFLHKYRDQSPPSQRKDGFIKLGYFGAVYPRCMDILTYNINDPKAPSYGLEGG